MASHRAMMAEPRRFGRILEAVRRRKTTHRTRQVLVAVQVTSSVVLVILALLARGDRLRETELSFDYRRTIVVEPHLTARTLSPDAQSAVLRDMLPARRALRIDPVSALRWE